MIEQHVSNGISLDKLLAHTADGVFILDSQWRFILFNPACERLTGFTASEIQGTDCLCSTIFDCHDEHDRPISTGLCPARSVLKGEASSARRRINITTKDGRRRWVETVYTAIGDHEGRPEYIIGVMRDISELKKQEDEWFGVTKNLRQQVDNLRSQIRERYGFGSIICQSSQMQGVLEKIRVACSTSTPVLICGEKGTGKHIVARTIHYSGLQKDGPFVPANCSGLSQEKIEHELFGYVRGGFVGASYDYPGLFQAANGGTLFMDNIGALLSGSQMKLLRSLRTKSVRPIGSANRRPVDVRVIVATNRPLLDVMSSGALREDLYYDLSSVTIEIPPLRMRKGDIPFLVQHFIVQLNQQGARQVSEVAPEVWATLADYDWPGNVRELKRVIESAFSVGKGHVLRKEELTLSADNQAVGDDGELLDGHARLDDLLAGVERRVILAALRRARGSRSLAAKLMNISRSRLYRRMDALGIAPREEIL